MTKGGGKTHLDPTAFSKTLYGYPSYSVTMFPISGTTASQHIVLSTTLGVDVKRVLPCNEPLLA